MKTKSNMTVGEVKAFNILELVKQHKKDCKNPNCGISTYYLLEDFERHLSRKATQEEFKNFI